MRIKSCTVYALSIPFAEAFSHSAKRRKASDSIVVKLEARDGAVGYGEGVARSYVTGETVQSSINHIRKVLWPAVATHDYEELMTNEDALHALASVDESLPVRSCDEVIAFNAARSAVELALIDTLLRSQRMSLSEILPARRLSITYGGVISSGSTELAVRRARQLELFGIRKVKIKIKNKEDVTRVLCVREAMGPGTTLRVDANGAFDTSQAIEVASELASLDIVAFEQPIARKGGANALAKVRSNSLVPIMADESLVTIDDARALIQAGACDFFNLRISKCGGLRRTLQLAHLAEKAGVRLQLGSQVGETAILSAAGRHLAAHLERAEFIEGSYGELLLAEDLGRDSLHFGHGGRAPLLRGPGLGVDVREQVLEKYSLRTIHLEEVSEHHV